MNTIIVEDEKPNSAVLEAMLKEYCPQVKFICTFDKLTDAVNGINKLKPDLIFLDIMLGNENGFDILDRLAEPLPKIIFTTAFDNYAIKAFKVSAVDYLLKPINIKELQAAVKKAQSIVPQSQLQHFTAVKQNVFSGNGKFQKISLPTSDGFMFTDISKIIRLEADGSYTRIYFTDKQSILVSRQLKDFQEMLDSENFFRVHHSHLVNLSHVVKYIKGTGGFVVMADNAKVEVALRRKDELKKVLQVR